MGVKDVGASSVIQPCAASVGQTTPCAPLGTWRIANGNGIIAASSNI
jgi:hypothetical protein